MSDENDRYAELLDINVRWLEAFDERSARYRGTLALASTTLAARQRTVRPIYSNHDTVDRNLVAAFTKRNARSVVVLKYSLFWIAALRLCADRAAGPEHRARVITDLEDLIALRAAIEANPAGKNSPSRKRQQTATYPANWRELVDDAITPSWRKLAYRVLACCGARPAELQRGVEVGLSYHDGRRLLTFWIWGAKVTAVVGQPWRIVTIDADTNIIAQRLAASLSMPQHAKSGGVPTDRGLQVVGPGSARRLRGIFQIAERALPQLAPLSPYSLRHQFVADLNRTGASVEEIAGAIGHIAGLGLRSYGGGAASRGHTNRLELVAVQTARPVREPDLQMWRHLMELREKHTPDQVRQREAKKER